jgi:branched-chain amino acid transport system substrate-binding protein
MNTNPLQRFGTGVLRAAALCALVAAAAGCRDERPIRIGVVVGEAGVTGAQAAAEAVNAAGGIDGRPLELVLLPDWAVDAERAIEGAEHLVADPTVLAVVGHSNSSASLAASQVYNAHGLAHLAPTSTATLLTLAGPYSFRLVPGDTRQAEFLAATGRTMAGMRTAAILYENTDYGRGLQRDVSRALEAANVRLVATVPFVESAGGDAVARLPSRVQSDPPQVIYYLGNASKAPELLDALRPVLPDVLVLASDGLENPLVYDHPERFAGLHFVRFVDPESDTPCMRRLRARASSWNGGVTENVLAHDAVTVIAEVFRSGARSRRAVRSRLQTIGSTAPPVQGCAGPIAFDAAGDVDRPYLLARVDPHGVSAVAPDH